MKYSLLCCLFAFSLSALAQKTYTTLQVPSASRPGQNEFCLIDTSGKSVLPSGRYVTPAGQTIRITNDPFGLALAPNGAKAVTLHDGVMTLLNLTGPKPAATRVPDYAGKIPSPVRGGTFLGVAMAPDNRTAYLSNGDKGRVIVFDTETLRTTDTIDLNRDKGYTDSFTSDLLLNGNELLALDRANFRLVRIDLKTKKITASIPTGRQPFGLAISPDRKTVFVANVGLYSYPLVPGVTKANKDTMMLKFPAYGAHSKESREGVEIEGRKIPGLGDPLADEAMSVWLIDLASNKVTAKLKTGVQIGEMIEEAEVVGGSSPNSVVVGRRFAYVSNATNDNISIIDYKARKLAGIIPLKIDRNLDRYRGTTPFGLTLSNDEKTLYVALLAFNAVAVVDVPTRRVKGLIPTGWGPTRVALSPAGNGQPQKTLYVASARGYGAGPNGGAGFVKPPAGTYIGDIQLGTFQAIPVPDAPALAAYTRQVLNNTYRTVAVTDDPKNPLPPLPKVRKSPIKHIVYITKENRTYDEVLGQLQTGKGDSTLARFGTGVTLKTRISTTRGISGRTTDQPGDSIRVANADIMPNHIRMARQWAFSDNFYCDSDASIHGHHWMMGTIPNEWVEANAASEGRFDAFSKAPGRRFPKSSGGIDPEDYNEIGGLWESMERSKVSFYNFGQVNEFAGNYEEQYDTTFGTATPVVFPMPDAAFRHTSRNFAGYNTNIPDQFRMDQFEREFTAKWLGKNKQPLPQLITVMLPNDHGAGPRPTEGYPYLHSYMADNDLALGRMLHFLSRTPYWKDMLVIVTEDDPQGGVDHVDAHRSLLMLAGPYVKRGYVSHTHANFGSILKVIYNLLNVDYVNQYDATASLLQDFFIERRPGDKPDLRPYDAVLPDVRVFDPQEAMKPYKSHTFDWRKIQRGPEMDDRAEQRIEHYRQQGEQNP
ncbi:bifunctional YncE family protein/alkaline phosphatase family protein [Spirosoma rhododendri]|uniref:Bifunctional YncE family protein/alkaline phosphatase family protein n=1 Tax=Spirosoma rhododendri TaxID=2728024 RepID=A0A7L5DL73_9BACT|nr:bifunctional YncE family protein/alkaline phosphatase family protein [Spirosoma rhododendri]QJD79176.1 bifunctional YncE family protein/alkaline phosphatase family protein [Spirosoma rhododendri]